MKEGNIIVDKSKAFALRILKLHDYLIQKKVLGNDITVDPILVSVM